MLTEQQRIGTHENWTGIDNDKVVIISELSKDVCDILAGECPQGRLVTIASWNQGQALDRYMLDNGIRAGFAARLQDRGQVLELCGGASLFASLAEPVPAVALEAVVEAGPQVIMASAPVPFSSEG